MIKNADEKTIFRNRFGSVTDKRVIFYSKGSQKEVLLENVGMVGLEFPYKAVGIPFIILGFISLPLFGFGVIPLIIGTFYRYRTVIFVETTGGKISINIGSLYKRRKGAENLVASLRSAIR